MPKAGDLDLSGLDMPMEKVNEATHIDLDEWKQELESLGEFFEKIGPTMPEVLRLQRSLMLSRIDSMKKAGWTQGMSVIPPAS